MSFFITVFPNNQGGVRFMMQETQSKRVLKQGEFQSEINLSERDSQTPCLNFPLAIVRHSLS